jgi:hypothetical protein
MPIVPRRDDDLCRLDDYHHGIARSEIEMTVEATEITTLSARSREPCLKLIQSLDSIGRPWR